MLVARDARPEDHAAFVALVPELQVDDPVPSADDWWAVMGPQTVVLADDGRVVAYIYFQILAGTGYIRHVVVDPQRRARGLGRLLMATVADRLRAAGCARWCLNVKPDNAAALALYHRVGMRLAHRSAAVRFTWDLVDRLPEGDMSLTTCPIDPAEDAALERALDLPPGQLASHRRNPRRIDVRLHDPRAPHDLGLGLASFIPSYPGAFPFRVARPTLARPLLTGLRAHASPDRDHVQVVLEGDEPLTALLVAAGARVHMEFLHLRGDLPDP
jgi:GNAT superfamily N-acetyltransferase